MLPTCKKPANLPDKLNYCCRQSGNYDLLILAQTKGLNATVLNAARDIAIPVAVALISNRYGKAAQPHAHSRLCTEVTGVTANAQMLLELLAGLWRSTGSL